ncbi:MAG: nuclease-related domain-containing protein [Chitinophagales bacterium]
MCKVYNQIGSLTAVKSHLHNHNVYDFKSINELIAFQKNYSNEQLQIISNHTILIEKEKNELNNEIEQLNDLIEKNKNEFKQKLDLELEQLRQQLDHTSSSQSNILKTVIFYLKRKIIKRKIQNIQINFDTKFNASVQSYLDSLSLKNNRREYITSHFMSAVDKSSSSQLQELKRKKEIIDQIKTSIYGAVGEHKVSKELENLSDDYILINDFTCTFDPPIYNRKENYYIKSIQIDHLLISLSGIFIIETKNWSEDSIANIDLRSPVKQIKRTGHALYILLANHMNSLLAQHHWGNRKIPIRNLIVLINQKPIEEFEYVKILTLKQLRQYIEYFKPNLSIKETQQIANYLLSLNESNN